MARERHVHRVDDQWEMEHPLHVEECPECIKHNDRAEYLEQLTSDQKQAIKDQHRRFEELSDSKADMIDKLSAIGVEYKVQRDALLEACEAALVAQEARTRKVMLHIADEYDPTRTPMMEHTLAEEETAERKLKAAIKLARGEGHELPG